MISRLKTLSAYLKWPARTLLGRTLWSVLMLVSGIIRYFMTGKTPASAQLAMIWLFCISGGKSNDAASKLISLLRPKVSLEETNGILGVINEEKSQILVRQLREDGYLIFPSALSSEVCDELVDFAMSTPAVVRPMDYETSYASPRESMFEISRPIAARYDYKTSDLLENINVQALLADTSLIHIAQEYLGCAPISDVMGMWWHTNYLDRPDSEAAQYFHFDMDRPKWLKVFIYLNDVEQENGPHNFVKGSHKMGGIPFKLLRKGYARQTDHEVAQEYPKERIKSFSAPRGTVIVEDTRGLHKGGLVTGSPRLLLQFQLSNSLFGGAYSKVKFGRIIDPKLKSLIAKYPSIYQKYT